MTQSNCRSDCRGGKHPSRSVRSMQSVQNISEYSVRFGAIWCTERSFTSDLANLNHSVHIISTAPCISEQLRALLWNVVSTFDTLYSLANKIYASVMQHTMCRVCQCQLLTLYHREYLCDSWHKQHYACNVFNGMLYKHRSILNLYGKNGETEVARIICNFVKECFTCTKLTHHTLG